MSITSNRPHSDRRVSTIFLVLLAVMGASAGALWTDWGNARFGVFMFVVAGWLVSLCLHEYAHARTALHGGDISVGTKGYLTLNPLKYTHPVYSFIMPLVFIILGGIALPGGAVFIERGRIQGKWKHSAISAAGPAVNAASALVLLVVLALVPTPTAVGPANFYSALGYLALLQLMAAILNLLPVPGLDGYGIIEPWLSYDNRRAFAGIAPYGMIIVFLLLWNSTINSWFFNTVIFNLMRWFGQSWTYAQFGNYLFHFFNLNLGGIFGH
ncbi:site-2 protease family protein [Streptacidiphilus sp. PB12-B1b]|uniref:site-2 protease family protein n=1 Tax=Streptacidiphilus sp. PB12-B1b TaxID=2705012 RepID=UPI0015FB91ED|nr:site-2 protease family protein [Streptacidiphilus sp. PB12-B1b]QMU75783.1 site-2 protease family protein [Streptacidiphilus sp. PB12-B1b]